MKSWRRRWGRPARSESVRFAPGIGVVVSESAYPFDSINSPFRIRAVCYYFLGGVFCLPP